MFQNIEWDRAAGYGGMIYVLGIVTIVGVIFICLSYGLWELSNANVAMCASKGIACSQQRMDTLNLILQYWYVIPIFVGVLILVYLIKYGLESEGGNSY